MFPTKKWKNPKYLNLTQIDLSMEWRLRLWFSSSSVVWFKHRSRVGSLSFERIESREIKKFQIEEIPYFVIHWFHGFIEWKKRSNERLKSTKLLAELNTSYFISSLARRVKQKVI